MQGRFDRGFIAAQVVSHMELRSEESADVRPYVHDRTVCVGAPDRAADRHQTEVIVVPLGPELDQIKVEYMKVFAAILKPLYGMNVLRGQVRVVCTYARAHGCSRPQP